MHNTLMESLQMEVKEKSKNLVAIAMPVTGNVKQPAGFLHGGATVALAETAASIGGMEHVDVQSQAIVGMEINCNHLRAKKDGVVIAKATPIHIGKRTMVWNIQVKDEDEELIAISRCTLGVINKL